MTVGAIEKAAGAAEIGAAAARGFIGLAAGGGLQAVGQAGELAGDCRLP
jgi:hypothetical protein